MQWSEFLFPISTDSGPGFSVTVRLTPIKITESMMKKKFNPLALLIPAALSGIALSSYAEDTIVVTAEKQNLQAPGVSTITADTLRKTPPSRDLSEIIRTQPGINLTGNSTSGQRGNGRQIDIRGMGPENTLILVDGKPVTSRNSIRLGWRGERDTRGDTNWVAPELIERIDIIRGPAAVRYGNGAAGGVVNIITKQPTNQWHGSWDAYYNVPEHKSEGGTRRTAFSLNGPLSDEVFLRLNGSLARTQADAWNINESHRSVRTGIYSSTMPAGREGVTDKNINALLRWDFAPRQSLTFETGYGNQSNLYSGDTQNTNSNDLVVSKYGDITNRIYRQNYSLTWNGGWDSGVTTSNWVRYERTRNSRIDEGLAGGTEGIFSNDRFVDINLTDLLLHSEVNLPIDFIVNQTLTLGSEFDQQKMKDNASNTQALQGGLIPGYSSTSRSPYSNANIFSLFAEDNMELTDSTMLTPALRFDHHTITGTNWSPSLNLSQGLGDDFTLKMGIGRAYKAPSLYQTNPNYILYSKGQGCYASGDGVGCYMMGNNDLKAETSTNKEIGLEFKHEGWLAGLTWFRNDYHNKIEAGYAPIGQTSTTNNKGETTLTDIYQWQNISRAVVEGLEGSFNVPFTDTLTLNNNLTWMLQTKNKETGDKLSVIPKYTLNSTLSWQARDDLSLNTTLTWYGKQEPKKYNYKGKPATGSETKEVSPYSLVGFSATWDAMKNVSLTGGVSNIFDKRHWREGNSQTTCSSNPGTSDCNGVSYIYGAGANTYNESGRTWYMSINTRF